MLILMTAALAAAAPAEQPMPPMNMHEQHMSMHHGDGAHKVKCCDCCEDMAKDHEGHSAHRGRETR
jgi:hypothetical protein